MERSWSVRGRILAVRETLEELYDAARPLRTDQAADRSESRSHTAVSAARLLRSGKGFSSQYAGQETVSCATSAICIYALSETGQLSHSQKHEFQRVLLAFRETVPAEQAGASPSATEEDPSAWTTAQAAL
jgi:hypothetical protein